MQACSAMSHFAGTALVVELLSPPLFANALATLAFASWPMNTKTKLPRTKERKMWQLPVSALSLPPR